MRDLPDNLQALETLAQQCERCSLSRVRTNTVFGTGDPNARLMFIGEAPGYHEDQQGRPFVGAAGKLLDKLLQSIGLDRDQVYIANVLKCRPPQNRDPKPEEIEVCTPLLYRQIELIKPRVVCTLGNHASRLILQRNVSISKVHGQEFPGQGYLVMPIYHPAAALYLRTTQAALEEDFLKLKEVLASRPQVPETVPEQMGLF